DDVPSRPYQPHQPFAQLVLDRPGDLLGQRLLSVAPRPRLLVDGQALVTRTLQGAGIGRLAGAGGTAHQHDVGRPLSLTGFVLWRLWAHRERSPVRSRANRPFSGSASSRAEARVVLFPAPEGPS